MHLFAVNSRERPITPQTTANIHANDRHECLLYLFNELRWQLYLKWHFRMCQPAGTTTQPLVCWYFLQWCRFLDSFLCIYSHKHVFVSPQLLVQVVEASLLVSYEIHANDRHECLRSCECKYTGENHSANIHANNSCEYSRECK